MTQSTIAGNIKPKVSTKLWSLAGNMELDVSTIAGNMTSYTTAWNKTSTTDNITIAEDRFVNAAKAGLPFLTVVTIWILIVNTMIIIAPIIHRPLRKKAYIFLSNLAVADFLSSASVIFFLITSIMGIGFPYGHYPPWFQRTGFAYFVFCKAKLILATVPVYASVLNLLLIAVDRYTAIVHPLKHHAMMTRGRIIAAISSFWILAIFMGFLIAVWNRNQPLTCSTPDVPVLYGYLCVALPFIIIITAIYTLYIIMYRKIAERSRSPLFTSGNLAFSRAAMETEKKFTLMLLIILGVFTICWVPFIVILLLRLEGVVSQLLYLLGYCFAYLNSGMNFIIYAVANDKYRAAFKKILCCCVMKVRKRMKKSPKDTKREVSSNQSNQTESIHV